MKKGKEQVEKVKKKKTGWWKRRGKEGRKVEFWNRLPFPLANWERGQRQVTEARRTVDVTVPSRLLFCFPGKRGETKGALADGMGQEF